MRCSFLLIAIAVAVAGCASSATTQTTEDEILPATPTAQVPRRPGSGSSEGVLAGTSFVIADAVVLASPLSDREPSRRGARIMLTTDEIACTRLDTVRAGGGTITFDIDLVDGIVAPGTYTVPEAFAAGRGSVVAHVDAATAECHRKTVVPGVGKVTVATGGAGRVSGTFELTSGRDTIRGAFDAAPCGAATPSPLTIRCQK